jgi:D-alanyl-D-alanine carboxypeptidase
MSLVEQGKLSLDQTIDKALPDLPNSDRITVRMLLDHSSGLADYFQSGEIDRIIREYPDYPWTREEILSYVGRPRFEPGARHAYSNTNYVALGGVLEHYGGAGIEEQFDAAIGEPLQLRDATFVYDDALLPRLAHPHSGGRYRPFRDKLGNGNAIGTDYWGEAWTDGGLVTCSPELARIYNALYAGDLLDASTIKQMLPRRVNGYGLGTFQIRAAGHTWTGHDGLYGGYAVESWTDRSRDLTLTVMTNAHGYQRGEPAATDIWRQLARALSPSRAR